MPARTKRKRIKTKSARKGRKYLYLAITIFLFIIGFLYIFRTRSWNSKSKFSLLINNDENMIVVVADPVLGEMYRIEIPGNTEIEVAGNLGKWKVRTLWPLGKQEKIGGKLAARSIIMGLGLPIYAWADKPALGLIDVALKPSFNALFSSYESNLTFGDRLHLFLFAIKTKNTKKVSVDLSETSFLEKSTLLDESAGYEVSNTPQQNILAIFSEPSFSDGIVRVSIKDATGIPGSAERVGKVIEALGGKVSSVVKTSDFQGKCNINTKEEELLEVLTKVFRCEGGSINEDQAFDVELNLGEEFSEYY